MLLPNATLCDKLEVMRKTQVYLHTTLNEDFGIAIVEAMVAGLVPVAHKSGGPWNDIFQRRQGFCGYVLETIEEASTYISELLDHITLRLNLVDGAMERAQMFSEHKLRSSILSIVNAHALEVRAMV